MVRGIGSCTKGQSANTAIRSNIMQVRLITKDFIQSAACTVEILKEIAVKLGYTQAAADKMATQPLKTRDAAKANGTTGTKPGSSHAADLPGAKLRTILLHKFAANDCEYGCDFAKGELTMEIHCLPDLDIGKAGSANKKAGATGPRRGKLTGEYKVVKCTKPNGPTNGGDAGMWEIWKHIWECTSFEEYFAKCPAKGVKSGGKGSVISASSEMNYAIKCGFIVPVAKATQEQRAA